MIIDTNFFAGRASPVHSACAKSASPTAKQCWICWESDHTSSNPLIRSCSGCKSQDLQFAHQSCMDKYMVNLLVSRAATLGTGSIPGIPYLDQQVVNVLAEQRGDDECTGESMMKRSTSSLSSLNSDENSEYCMECMGEECAENSGQCMHLRNGKLRCTRCTDKYSVLLRRVSPFRVIMHDRLLRLLSGLMSLCVVVLAFACAHIFVQANAYLAQTGNARGLMIQSWVLGGRVDIRLWAAMMCGVFTTAYAITMAIVYHHLSGFWEVRVLPKRVGQKCV